MAKTLIHHQQHGYKNGHQLLVSSIKLSPADQDVVDRLSDLSGPLQPGEVFEPYLTGYPLVSNKYYVLAQTSQDLDSPRSGCVVTHSLIVPMKIWEGASCVSSLVKLLRPVDRLVKDQSPLVLSEQRELLPSVKDPRVSELVEALFLENRQPIVMFDVPEAELIIERLLTAFWSGLRSSFCFSTLALAPRTIGGRTFDLLFAPKTARTRFSEWNGRKIDVLMASPNLSRHRWTDLVTQNIFKSEQPSLLTSDVLGFLNYDDSSDETVLRLSLLWSELLEKSETSPNAILGMLDILNSQSTDFSDTLIQITPLIERGVHLAEHSFSDTEAWEFMVTLLGKFTIHQPPMGVHRQLRRTSAVLAKTEPEIAFQFLKHYDVIKKPVPPILLAGLAKGLTRSVKVASIVDNIMQLEPITGLRLIAFSPSFSKFIINQTTAESSSEWINTLNTVLDTTEIELRSRARRNIVPQLDNSIQASLLEALLKDIDIESLRTVVSKIWAKTHFEIEEFDAPICQSARSKDNVISLRDTITSVNETTESNRFLLSTLCLTTPDIEWLCNSTVIKNERVISLLDKLLSQSDDHLIASIISDVKISSIIATTLLTDIKLMAKQLVRVLLLGQLPIRQFIDVGLKVLPHTKGQVRKDLIHKILSRGLSEASEDENDLLKIIITVASKTIDPSQLIKMATPYNGTITRISDNVLLLNEVKPMLRKSFLTKIDELTTRLTHSKRKGFEAKAIIAWSSMLEDSGDIDSNAQLRAAGVAFPYALDLLDTQISPLIVAAFPVIYAELRTSNEPLGIFDRFLFKDWDRCKVARRNLVNAYMDSLWPPADLLLVAILADESEKILRRVARKSKGKIYLAAIKDDLVRFPKTIRKQLASELSKFQDGTVPFKH